MKETQPTIHFLFTEDGFCVDDRQNSLSDPAQAWERQFEEDRYAALYHLGFVEKPAQLDEAGCFLYQLSDTFFRVLTSQPDIELTRENAVVRPDEDLTVRLLDCVPFTLGSEHVTKDWLVRIFEKLNEIYAGEIRGFDGTVAMYLAEKSQHLKVPERIFFHLVESRDEDYPFAFLATYATKDENEKVRHVPLQYALTEYKKDRNKLMELLSCLNQVADVSPIIGEFVEKGEMFQIGRAHV